MRLPIGETFEHFINWLRESLGGFFNAVASILDWAITTLERALLLDPAYNFPSVAFALTAGLLAFFLTRHPKRSWRLPTAMAGIVILTVGGLETWRLQTMRQQLQPDQAQKMAENLDAFAKAFNESIPQNFDLALDALTQTTQTLEKQAPELGESGEEALRIARNTAVRIERLRPQRHRDAMRQLERVTEALASTLISPQHPVSLAIENARRFYAALEAGDETARLARNLRRINEPQGLVTAINARTYERTLQTLQHAHAQFELLGAGDLLRSRLQNVENDLLKLNPKRLNWYPWIAATTLLITLAWLLAGRGLAIFCLIGMPLIVSMGFWQSTMETLALVLSATLFALCIGVPAGVLSAQSPLVDRLVRPVLDFMQTMPAFVYLIPAVLLFGLGKVPGAMATLIFAMPPAVRLTALGIRQVPSEVVEAAQAFGATTWQMLLKAQLPIALPTILAGVNQTIMLALSMVVIGGMIGAGGLGEDVLSGITQLKIGLGFESGISVVILAIFLDRLTQSLGSPKR